MKKHGGKSNPPCFFIADVVIFVSASSNFPRYSKNLFGMTVFNFYLDPEMPAIIMASNSPCILIKNMVQGHTVKLGYLRIVHRGMREEDDEKFNIYDEMNELNEQAEKLNNNIIYKHLQG